MFKETKLKKYWYCLLGKELYVYKNKSEEKHKGMHNLANVFIKDDLEEHLDSTTVLYPFTLVFPGNKPRTFYDIKDTLGKGKFGLVKSAIHKKTGRSVAVKVMSKKEMTV